MVPCYLYSSRDNYVVDETPTVLRLYKGLLGGVVWGVSFAIFNTDGPALGIALTSLFLLLLCVTTALCVSHTNTTLIANAAKFADTQMIEEAAAAARKAFQARNSPLEINCPEYEAEAAAEDARMGFSAAYAEAGFVQDDKEDTRCAAKVAADIEALEDVSRDLYYSEAEALADALKGEGPMGWLCLGCFGKLVGFAMHFCMSFCHKYGPGGGGGGGKVGPENGGEDGDDDEGSDEESRGNNNTKKKKENKKKKKKKDKKKVEGGYEEELKAGGMRADAMDLEMDRVPAPDAGVLQSKLQALPAEDDALTRVFSLESRCQCHFQLLVSVAAEARLKRDNILLSKFLRNYRFSLISNGIAPPESIFRTDSYSSIDLRLVALWLSSLTVSSITAISLQLLFL